MSYTAPVETMLFTLRHVAGLDAARAEGWLAEPDDAALAALLEAAGAFATAELAPLNRVGDMHGARFADGAVTMPPGFAAAYRRWTAGGWNAVCASESAGGAGLPEAVGVALLEIWTSACMAFALNPLLTQAGVEVMQHFAPPELRALYLPKLVSGEWTATMNLTEPQAGSDLGALRCRAEPAEGGTWRLFGQKIFITYGEHDLAENIAHLVLARLPDAPAGSRGISLFLVPKILPGGARNDVRCLGIEHKLGIHASPTCTMAYGEAGGAIGWLIGAPHQGLACMFTMMNHARLTTGLQGVAVAERALQQASAYAAARVQGNGPDGTPVPIAAHPDVRRMLLSMQAGTQAGRALAYTVALATDRARRHPDAAERAAAAARVGLLTPVMKAFGSELGVEAASTGIQVHGGMGYIEETGAAQLLRDARIVPIYEGTNGIQAIDLALRKVRRDGGAAARVEIARMRAVAERVRGLNETGLGELGPILKEAAEALNRATAWMAEPERPELAILAVATPYLKLFGMAAAGLVLAEGALAAARSGGAANAGATARFFAEHVLVAASGTARTVMRAAAS